MHLDDPDSFFFVAQPVDEICDCCKVDHQRSNSGYCHSSNDLINLERNEQPRRDNGQILSPSALVPEHYSLDHIKGCVEERYDAKRLDVSRVVGADHDERFQDVRMGCAVG